MIARISEGDAAEIELSGTPLEWSALAFAVQHAGTVIPCESVGDPQPYARFGHQILISHAPNQKVRFEISGETVEIAGDPSHLETLSRTMAGLSASLPPGYHVHIEYQGDDHYIASGSVPTILLLCG
jgi:hypothetical protein